LKFLETQNGVENTLLPYAAQAPIDPLRIGVPGADGRRPRPMRLSRDEIPRTSGWLDTPISPRQNKTIGAKAGRSFAAFVALI